MLRSKYRLNTVYTPIHKGSVREGVTHQRDISRDARRRVSHTAARAARVLASRQPRRLRARSRAKDRVPRLLGRERAHPRRHRASSEVEPRTHDAADRCRPLAHRSRNRRAFETRRERDLATRGRDLATRSRSPRAARRGVRVSPSATRRDVSLMGPLEHSLCIWECTPYSTGILIEASRSSHVFLSTW